MIGSVTFTSVSEQVSEEVTEQVSEQSAQSPSSGRRGDPAALVRAVREGDRVALGRSLSLVEEAGDSAAQIDRLVMSDWPSVVVGITGPPGAGKSTLTDALVSEFRAAGRRAAVLAIDPTSPVSGGAILGDRVRMNGHSADQGVFIRSVATRGASGGLTTTVPGVLRVIAAAGFDTVLLETVGVGQIELDVAAVADTVLVVVTPGAGDEVQAVKAGVLEIASVFVLNKADLDGAAQTEADLLAALSLGRQVAGGGAAGWVVPVLRTVARSSEGVNAVVAAVAAHGAWLVETGRAEEARLERHRRELASRVEQAFLARAARVVQSGEFSALVEEVASGGQSVGDALQSLLPPP